VNAYGVNRPMCGNVFYNGRERKKKTEGDGRGKDRKTSGCVGIFFTTEGNGRKKNGKGTEGEKTGKYDWSVEWNDDGETTFFVHRATARCTKRVSI